MTDQEKLVAELRKKIKQLETNFALSDKAVRYWREKHRQKCEEIEALKAGV